MASDTPPSRPPARERLAAERAAAARKRIEEARRRRLLMMVGAPVLAIVVVVAVLVAVKLVSGSSGPKSGKSATAADQGVITRVTTVPTAVLDKIGIGSISRHPTVLTGVALTAGGKPRVLYVGAEYCPFCAAERWSVVVALARFGSFANLGQASSSAADTYPSTATLTFHGASYRSNYITFTGKELQGNRVVNGKYATLDTLSSGDRAVFDRVNPSGSIPVLDLGGKYLIAGASYDPGVLKGSTHAQIAAALSDSTSGIAKSVDGAANLITAAICALTANRPTAVCATAAVRAATPSLSNG